MSPRIGLAVFLLLTLIGCVQVPQPKSTARDELAVSVLQQSAAAQGMPALLAAKNVHVHFEGRWSWIVPRVQPVLVDNAFRGSSSETFATTQPNVEQTHTGPAGTKYVTRIGGTTHVYYNGIESSDKEVRDAAALVVDDYRMFLFGPAFFVERGAPVQYLGVGSVDGMACDEILAVLKPGLGNSDQDRVVLSIDQKNHWLRRVRITVQGMESTRGAVADIFLRDQIRIDGMVFPTRFYEELKSPFDASVHHWRLTEIHFDATRSKAP